MTIQFSMVKKGLSRQRLENPPNPLYKGEIADLCWALSVLHEVSGIKLSVL